MVGWGVKSEMRERGSGVLSWNWYACGSGSLGLFEIRVDQAQEQATGVSC